MLKCQNLTFISFPHKLKHSKTQMHALQKYNLCIPICANQRDLREIKRTKITNHSIFTHLVAQSSLPLLSVALTT